MDVNNDIRDIKERIGQDAERIIAEAFGMEKKGGKYRCPNGIAHSHGDRNPSMSWDKKALQFYCFTCEEKIDIYTYYRKLCNFTHAEIVRDVLGRESDFGKSLKETRDKFSTAARDVVPITQACRDYIHKRGVSDETIDAFGLQSIGNYIAFPYKKGWSLVGYKLRLPVANPNPKMTSLPGSKPYLFNSQNVDPGDELIICEGEFDAMIIWQCGFHNVVSVGAGAGAVKVMIEQARDFMDQFKTLIIVADDDDAGMKMNADFVDEFGVKVKLVDRALYHGLNDVNLLYYKSKDEGKNNVVELIESGRWKIKGRRDLDKTPYKGVTRRNDHFIPTGIQSIDFALNDLRSGCVTLITGRTNGGKTTLVKQIVANAIDLGNKVYVMMGEGSQEQFINSLYQCVIGNDPRNYNIVKVNKREHKEPKPDVLKALRRWHKGKLIMFNKGESELKTTEQLFDMLEVEVKLNQHHLVVIDNLMSILKAKSIDKLEAQADFMQRCHDLADAYGTHIILILHPNKTYVKGQDLELEQMSGTSDLANKADNVIAVIRSYDEQEHLLGISGRIVVGKNRYYPDLPTCDIMFDPETGQLMEILDGVGVGYNFNWSDFLVDYPTQIEMEANL